MHTTAYRRHMSEHTVLRTRALLGALLLSRRHVGESFRFMAGCISGLGVQCRIDHDFNLQIAAEFMKHKVLWFIVKLSGEVDPTL